MKFKTRNKPRNLPALKQITADQIEVQELYPHIYALPPLMQTQ